MTNKWALCSNDITLLENGNFISNEREVADIFNDYYINIVELTSGKVPLNVAPNFETGTKCDGIIDQIIETYKDHPSIRLIKSGATEVKTFSFKFVTEEVVLSHLKSVDSKKSVGVDLIPPRIIKDSAAILAKPLTNLINLSIQENVFPSKAKIAAVLPFFKKEDRLNKKNYRPISVLSSISKIFEKI